MTFDQIHDHLWAVRWDGEDDNEVNRLFEQWHDVSYLRGFFKKNSEVIYGYFRTNIKSAIEDTIEDAEYLETQLLDSVSDESLDALFAPLGPADSKVFCLQRNKARNETRTDHHSWLRIYALKLDGGHYLITGGAIKMAKKMQDNPETDRELHKLNECRNYLKSLGIKDIESLNDYLIEEN